MDHQKARDATARLARLTLAHKHGNTVTEADALNDVVAALTWRPVDRADLDLPGAEAVTAEDTIAGLHLVEFQRSSLDYDERDLIEAAKDRGLTWEALGAALDRSAQAMQQRYKRLGGERAWPTSTPKTPKHKVEIDYDGDENGQIQTLYAELETTTHEQLMTAQSRGDVAVTVYARLTPDSPLGPRVLLGSRIRRLEPIDKLTATVAGPSGVTASTEQCPSLMVEPPRLFACGFRAGHRGDHGGTGKDVNAIWTDRGAVPVPWPKEQEPPAGINVLRDVDNVGDGYLTYLCRVVDRPGQWSWQDKPERNLTAEDLQGRRTRDWSATLAASSTGALVVVRP